MKKILSLVMILGICFVISGCGSETLDDGNSANKNTNNTQESTDGNQSNNNSKKVYGFNETFNFDDLEITFSSNYSFVTVDNKYSDYNGEVAIKLPVSVKNLKDETYGLGMFYYDIYGSKGTQMERLGSFFDEDIDYAGKLRSGASYTKYMYFQYDGDGTYSIEFDNYDTKEIVEFEIKKQ